MARRKSPIIDKNLLLPPFIGIFMMLLVFGVINSQLISGKIAAIASKPDPATVETNDQELSAENTASLENTVRINSIGVEAPLIVEDIAEDEATFQRLLQNGVVHYPFTSAPGQPGNSVIFGHSSGRWWAPGDYKFVFSRLNQIQKENKIFIDYSGKRYIYSVQETKIVAPNDVSVLKQTQDQRLTIITCHPVGSNAQRFIVVARQISPLPDSTKEGNNLQPSILPNLPNRPPTTLPGQTPSLWETIQSAI